MGLWVKVSFVCGGVPVTVEVQADSLSALDYLGWLVARVVEWVGEVQRLDDSSRRFV